MRCQVHVEDQYLLHRRQCQLIIRNSNCKGYYTLTLLKLFIVAFHSNYSILFHYCIGVCDNKFAPSFNIVNNGFPHVDGYMFFTI